MKTNARYLKLVGTNEEIGAKLGSICLSIPGMAEAFCTKEQVVSKQDEVKMYELFNTFCPGINEEIAGFAEVLKVPKTQVLYYAMTYLRPGCSQMAVLPSKTKNGHTLLARNYDFSEKVEEMTLTLTRAKGRYAHLSSSIMQFGRGDGMNEHGLAVSLTSAGIPVGNFEFAAKPAIVGLQFWAVIRSVLENCKTVKEAIEWTRDMPIAFNINMMLADKSGHAALVESFNGQKAVKEIDESSTEQFLCSANHVHLPELMANEPLAMRHSLVRYKLMQDTLEESQNIQEEDLKKLMSTKYPQGLCCHYYDDFFGTLRSMIFDPCDGTVRICFGSPDINSWYTFSMSEESEHAVYPVILEKKPSPEGFYDMVKKD